jgi:hypothetical protein
VKQEHLEAALEQQKQTKKKIGTLLVENGWISESTLAKLCNCINSYAHKVKNSARKLAPYSPTNA